MSNDPSVIAPVLVERLPAAAVASCQTLAGAPGRTWRDGVLVPILQLAVDGSIPGSLVELSGGRHPVSGVHIPHDLTIRGLFGSSLTRLAGQADDTLLAADDGAMLNLVGLSLGGGVGLTGADGRHNGGALFVGVSSTLRLERVEILHNTASHGGALFGSE